MSNRATPEQRRWLWIANQRLAIALDEMYAEDPSARPTDDEVERAAAALRP